ncbi:hypothetical protein PR048_022751 [Dryococelus australis]|uniref:Uncharacterized protein n=1 Tax=Dryococelus australis TaxID=614101 RepID=A0ABQ9GS43_9NEOP|nr:hypothetical protein PR048_022751 [Dryococelus australis]
MRVIEVDMERRWNEGAWEAEDPREDPPTNGIVRHDSHLRKSGDPAGRSYSVSHESYLGRETARDDLLASSQRCEKNVLGWDTRDINDAMSQGHLKQWVCSTSHTRRRRPVSHTPAGDPATKGVCSDHAATKQTRGSSSEHRVSQSEINHQVVALLYGNLFCGWLSGQTASLPPRANRVQSPAGSLPDFRKQNFANSFQDKIDVKHIYREFIFANGSEFIGPALHTSEPIADLQGNTLRIPKLPGVGQRPMHTKLKLQYGEDRKVQPTGRGKREIPENTGRPTASSGTIPTCQSPNVPGRGLNPDCLGGRRAD